jgi:hypothetical protein
MTSDEYLRKPLGQYYEELVGKHPDYGNIYRRGRRGQVGSILFVNIPAGGKLRGGEYSLCSSCKDPIFHELGEKVNIMVFDASQHLKCSPEWQLRHGPIPPERIPCKRKIEVNGNWTNTTKNTET